MHAAAPQPLAPWVVYCDGSALPNPGRIAIGAVLVAPDGTRHALSAATHQVGCNNEAELLALVTALEACKARGATTIRVHTDNAVVVEQLGPTVVRPVARLAAPLTVARALMGTFEDVVVTWIPRHRNAEADALARSAQGLAVRTVRRTGKGRQRRAFPAGR